MKCDIIFFQAEDGIRHGHVTGVQTCALPISGEAGEPGTEAALQAVFAALPDFPRFRLGRTFDTWVHELARTEDVAELATVLGSTSTRTFSRIIIAVTLVHGDRKRTRLNSSHVATS